MAPRTTPSRSAANRSAASRSAASRSAALVLATLLIGSVASAPQALAQSGNGLYEPFPEAAVKKRAQRYVERLGDRNPEAERRYSDAELAAGVFVRSDRGGPDLRPTIESRRGAASARARAGEAADVALPVQLLLLMLALALPATALMARARARAA